MLKKITEVEPELIARGSSFEVVETEIRGTTYKVWAHAPRTLRSVYKRAYKTWPQRVAVVYEDDRYSFADIWKHASALGHQLSTELGVDKGDRVAIAMRNYPEWVISFIAVTSIGGIAVAINAFWTGEEMEYGLTDSGAKLLIADSERLQRLAGRLPELRRVAARCDDPHTWDAIAFDELLEAGRGKRMPKPDIHTDDDATIFYTSGTTGFPKGAVGTHRGIISTLFSWAYYGALHDARGAVEHSFTTIETDHEIVPGKLLCTPLFHVTASHGGMLISQMQGDKIVLMYKWDPERALQLIERERLSAITGVPTMTWELLNHPRFAEYDVRSLRGVQGGGAAVPGGMVDKLPELLPKRHAAFGWGMTETNAGGTSNADEDLRQRPTSAGRPTPVVQLKIVDDRGNELPVGQTGELWIKSPMNIRCYWNKPEATAQAFTDGWLHTGDIARLDEEGFLYIVDRAKDMVLRGGENIYCAEVERVFEEFPDVQEAAAFGVPDDRLGEELAIVIMARQGTTLDEDVLRAYATERLAKFKIPRYMWFTDSTLPRGDTGKIQKRKLRAIAVEAMGMAHGQHMSTPPFDREVG